MERTSKVMILEGELTSSIFDKYINRMEDKENGRESEGKWKKIRRKMMTKSVGLEVAEKGYNYNQQVVRIGVLFLAVAVACLVLSNSVPRTYVLSQLFAKNSGFVVSFLVPLSILFYYNNIGITFCALMHAYYMFGY